MASEYILNIFISSVIPQASAKKLWIEKIGWLRKGTNDFSVDKFYFPMKHWHWRIRTLACLVLLNFEFHSLD